ncbi:NAD(P)-binding protein [Streptomyces sp. NBC_01353]|nr:NAD(P)-binding protein [Streptomyces sp. NBC_01353]
MGGGQSGLAAAHSLRREGLTPVLLEASEEAHP